MRAVILCLTAAVLQAQPVKPVFATYFGGGGYEIPGAVATAPDGSIYIAGRTDSSDFPVKNALQSTSRAYSQIAIAKFSASGELLYSTYYGGSANDSAAGIAVDRAGYVYITGNLHSKDFPTKNALQAAWGGGVDAFAMKLDPSGKVVYATYLGGRFNDIGTAVAVDAAGNAYLTGLTESPDFPVTPGVFQPRPLGYAAGFFIRTAYVTKLDPAGKLVYSTFLGGSQGSVGWSIAVDAAGQAHVAGETTSADFPVGGNALQWYPGRNWRLGSGTTDGFLSKLTADGSGIVYSTYLGGPGQDSVRAVTVDGQGRAFITGTTTHARLPILRGPQWYLGGDVLSVAGAGSNALTPRRTGLTAAQVTALAFDPNVPSLEYAGTQDGVFRSTDGGQTWTPAGLDRQWILQLAVDPSRPRTLFASTSYGGGIFRSADAGETWTSWNSGAPMDPRDFVFQALAVDPARSGAVYTFAGTGGITGGGSVQPVYRITDDGASWTLVGQGLPTTPGSLLAGPDSLLLAGTRLFQFRTSFLFGGSVRIPGNVFHRVGSEWVAGDLQDDIRALAFYDGILYAAGSLLYRSIDGGQTWQRSGLPIGGTATQIAIDPRNPATLYLLKDENGTSVLRSQDSGATFEYVDQGGATAIAVNPFDSSLHIGRTARADAFVAGFDPDGGMMYSSFVGGAGAETGDSIAVDPAGNVYIAGFRRTSSFLVDRTSTFVSRVDERGYTVDLGGTNSENILGMPCRALTVAPDGALIAVMQATEGAPVLAAAVQPELHGSADFYLVKWYQE